MFVGEDEYVGHQRSEFSGVPAYGRFVQPDPIGYADTANPYAYGRNDPVNYVDPLGLDAINCIGWAGCGSMVIVGSSAQSTFHGLLSFSISGRYQLRMPSLEDGGGNGVSDEPQSDKPNVLERAGKCALDHYGLNLGLIGSGGALAAAGANVIETRGKFAGTTPGTSWAGRAASAIYGDAKMAFKLPTLTGFPGIGNGLKLSSTLSAAKFAGRAVPVVGYALLAADALAIGICTVNSGE